MTRRRIVIRHGGARAAYRGALHVSTAGLLMMLTGCATVMNGTKQVIPVTSEPPGASVSVDGVPVGITPLQVTLARGRSHVVSVAIDSANTVNVAMSKKLSMWVFGNLFLYVAPALLDIGTGGAYKLGPDSVGVAFPGFAVAAPPALPDPRTVAGNSALVISPESRDTASEAADPVTARNALYVELGGTALWASANYERILAPHIAARVGISNLSKFEASSDSTGSSFVTGPVMVSYIADEGNRHFEAGAGALLLVGKVGEDDFGDDAAFSGAWGGGLVALTLGYRYQRPGGGRFFRAAFTPLIGGRRVVPWAGISWGYGF